jgi:tryptophanyl-tRNA synthetase
MSVVTQVADILFPQLDAGPGPTVVPVGVDQDPHLRLTRDVAFKLRMFTVEDRGEYISVRSKNAPLQALKDIERRFLRAKRYEGHVDLYGEDMRIIQDVVREVEICHGGSGFYTPSSTYHTFMPGLQGGKMSSSVPASLFSFDESEEAVKKKVMSAVTGGRTTLEEQKKLGGEPERCSIFQLNLFHMLPDDAVLAELRRACRAGEEVCGRCKKETADRVATFLREFQEKRKAVSHEVEP